MSAEINKYDGITDKLSVTIIGNEPVSDITNDDITYYKMQFNKDSLILPVYDNDRSKVVKLISDVFRVKYYVVCSEINFGGNIKIFLDKSAAITYMHEISMQTDHSYVVKEISHIADA